MSPSSSSKSEGRTGQKMWSCKGCNKSTEARMAFQNCLQLEQGTGVLYPSPTPGWLSWAGVAPRKGQVWDGVAPCRQGSSWGGTGCELSSGLKGSLGSGHSICFRFKAHFATS